MDANKEAILAQLKQVFFDSTGVSPERIPSLLPIGCIPERLPILGLDSWDISLVEMEIEEQFDIELPNHRLSLDDIARLIQSR